MDVSEGNGFVFWTSVGGIYLTDMDCNDCDGGSRDDGGKWERRYRLGADASKDQYTYLRGWRSIDCCQEGVSGHPLHCLRDPMSAASKD